MKKNFLLLVLTFCIFLMGNSQNLIGNGGFEYNTFPTGNAYVYVDPINSTTSDYIPCWTFGCPYNQVNTFPPYSPPSWPNAATVVTATTTTPNSGDFCSKMYRTYGATGTNSRNQVLRYHNDCIPALSYFAVGTYELSFYVKGVAWCPALSDGSGFSMNARLMADADCFFQKGVGGGAIPISSNWTKVSFCFEITQAEVNTFNELEFYMTHATGQGEHHIEAFIDDINLCLIEDAPDISHLDGQVCASDAIIEIPKGVGDYQIEVELAFQGVVCTINGTGPGTINIFDHCNLQCGSEVCYQITIKYERCGSRGLLTAQPHFICGPPADAYANPGVVCVGGATTLYAANCQPSSYIYQWYQSPSTLLGTGCSQYLPTTYGGPWYLEVTDPVTGCSSKDAPLIGWKLCDRIRKVERLANSNEGDNQINFYPNPANSHFIVEFENELDGEGMIQLIDATGKIVKQDIFSGAYNLIKVPTAELSAGIYFAKITANGVLLKSEKIMISH